jgi:hypothetical protein
MKSLVWLVGSLDFRLGKTVDLFGEVYGLISPIVNPEASLRVLLLELFLFALLAAS